MPLSQPDLKLLDPSTGQFVELDGGANTTRLLLMSILIELRVITLYMAENSNGLIEDDPAFLRRDISSDPGSFTSFTKTSNS